MAGLLADGWFYISSAGLLVSGALFFFLLGQYRAAADAADEAHGEETAVAEGAAHAPVRPVYIPEDSEPAKTVPLPVATASPAAEKRDALTGATLPGGVSPAMTYLQNLKTQLEEMGGELRGLTKKVAAISERDEALIERLADLTRAVEDLKASGSVAAAPAPALVEAPAPKKARKPAEPKPEPVVAAAPVVVEPPAPVPTPPTVELSSPAPEPVQAPAAAPAEFKIELGTASGTGAPVDAPVPEPEPAPKPKYSRAAALAEATLSGGEVQPVVAAEPAAAPVVEAAAEPAAEPVEAPAAETPEEKPRRGPVWPV